MSAIRDRLVDMHLRGHRRDVHGIRSENEMAPETRRDAAVLIAVTERAEEDGPGPGVFLIERPAKMRNHGGQVALPGGAIDPGENAVQAALREAHEEIALPLSAVHVIGPTDRYVTGTGFSITPILATVSPNLKLRANPAEVDEWFEAPLSHLLDPASWSTRSLFYRGRDRQFLETHWDGHHIWGATAGIFANLAMRLGWEGWD
ncbi:NUDIX hydrolase [Croceicoccus naphthovorans]|uniref:Uncharacterized protein n=1 Tax=Croceicoccus naphthovorans TaxID=1348774 RepID=A0A0G3XHU4_9SPHN|nr:CoA pyrophosphatase [Croceicoccus naphthovorans]AKM10186.1 hypothetical protein AB433_09705 [Croceicoccus naphthovorans]MBB3990576.1 8-oxo-dGTP pyrophosphatase MutT (NUDIX family) [Croceicoccus naphthovorans]